MSTFDKFLDKAEIALDYGSKVADKIDKATEPAVKRITPYVDTFAAEMQPIMERPIDWILFLYFASHIPITIFFDLQAIYPPHWVPYFLRQVNGSYVSLLKDPFMNVNRPTMYWFKSFVFCEAILQLPFFFFAAYGVFKDKKWVRLPLAIYGAHVMTTVLPCLVELFFSQDLFGLSDFQRNCLLCLYGPYFLIPCLGLVDSYIRINNRLKRIDGEAAVKKSL